MSEMTRPGMTCHPLPASDIAVSDLERARRFYVHALGFLPGARNPGQAANDDRLTLEFGEHTLELCAVVCEHEKIVRETVVLVLTVDDWCTVSERLQAHGVSTEILPGRRFSVTPGEQCTMSVLDPDGNTVELRGFAAEENQLAA